jgi:hypothetical protein
VTARPANHSGARASAPRSYVKTSSFGSFAEARSRLRAQPAVAVMANAGRTAKESCTADRWASLSAFR